MPTLREELLLAVRFHVNGVPEFDVEKKSIRTWLWCVVVFTHPHRQLTSEFRPLTTRSERVACYSLGSYRQAWRICNPFCLCGLEVGMSTESAIYVEVTGEYANEYVAGCALNRCGYLGKLHTFNIWHSII